MPGKLEPSAVLEPPFDPREEAACLPWERLEAEITELAGNLAAAECRWLLLVAEFDRRRGWEQWGCRSLVHWLGWHCALDERAAREKVRVARVLTQFGRLRLPGLPRTAHRHRPPRPTLDPRRRDRAPEPHRAVRPSTTGSSTRAAGPSPSTASATPPSSNPTARQWSTPVARDSAEPNAGDLEAQLAELGTHITADSVTSKRYGDPLDLGLILPALSLTLERAGRYVPVKTRPTGATLEE